MELLLVDDEKEFRDILAKRLARRGIQALEAASGLEALTRLREHPVDVIVLDVKMPGMSGLEALEQIKELHPDTEVILLTGNASTQDGVTGIKSGAFDYLTKPVEIEHLHRKITQAFHKIQRLRAEHRAQELQERIKQQMVVSERLVTLGTLATGVAHEINNPLAIIQDSAGWMRQILAKPELADIPRKPDFEKALDRIHTSVQRARRITQQLLQVVRTQSTDILAPETMEEVDLYEVSRECINLIEPEATVEGVALSLLSDEPHPSAWSDRSQLLQVILNLLSNAIQATPKGGSVSLSLSATLESAIIAARDNGCGIPEENLSKIFEPFFTTKPVSQGTGMGLYVSWGIINRLGGLISVESRVDTGSTFTITLPVKK